MNKSIVGALLLTAWVSGGGSAVAVEQHAHEREGFYIGAGLGWGSAGADLTVIEKVRRHGGGTGNFRLGWALRGDIVAGFEFSGWATEFTGGAGENRRWVFTVSSAAITYFPANVGAFVRGGIGFATSRVEETTGPDNKEVRQDHAGIGYILAAGYEFRFWPRAALAPQVEYAYLDINGDVTRDANYISLTIQLTGYW